MRETWLNDPAQAVVVAARQAAKRRQDSLTKPPGALGRLEEIVVELAGFQGLEQPSMERIRVVVFAADHGVYAEGVAAFPQAVTVEMIRNFASGGAAISVMARGLGADLEVVNVGTVDDPGELPGVVDARVGPGTANFADRAAMSETQLHAALQCGREAADRASDARGQLLICGEMGIANTTTAAALGCALTGASAHEMVGPGTGLDTAGVQHKGRVVQRALDLHKTQSVEPLEALRRVGGFEIAALTGCLIRAAQSGLPILVDGFIVTAAAFAAVRLNPSVRDWLLFGHRSKEPGHSRLLAALEADPLLDLGMRLGEGSGAAAAAHLLRLAVQLHNGMATFESAEISRS